MDRANRSAVIGGVVRRAIARVLRGALVGISVGIVLFALFLIANHASLHRDVDTARAHVRAAFATGALQDQDYLAGNTDIGRHQFNDCLILWQAIDQRATTAQLSISPLYLMPQTPGATLCGSLHGFVAGRPTATPGFYHRYIHGHTMLVRFLLPVLSVEAIRDLYQGILTLLVLAGIGVGLIGLARGRRREEALFWSIVFLAFSRWFGLETFGQSLGHGPSDIVVVGYCLFLAACAVMRGIDRRTALISAAVFGALTAIFEFLTGGIPLGMAIVIGGTAFAVHADRDANPARFALDAWAAFCAACLTCLALKIALVLWFFGPGALADGAAQLSMRIGLATARGETTDLGPLLMAKKLAKGIDALAPGMHLMAGGMVALSLAAGGWGASRLLRTGTAPALRHRTIALLVSNGVVFAMLALFWQHTMIHAWFMERVLVWTIATGFALFALACRGVPLVSGSAPDR